MLNKPEAIKPIHLKKVCFFSTSVIYLTLIIFCMSGETQLYSLY